MQDNVVYNHCKNLLSGSEIMAGSLRPSKQNLVFQTKFKIGEKFISDNFF